MKEKTKTNWEHFYNYLFIINEEIDVAQKQVYWGCYAGERKKMYCDNLQQLVKADTEQTYAGIIQARLTMIENTYSFYLLDWRHTLRHTLGQNKPS